MAFKFNWTTFDKSFIDEAQDKLAEALNKGITNQMIGSIKVEELNMGTKAPDLEVMEIGDLSEEKFKGIFKIIYQGDAYIVIRTTVQINPLVVSETPITLSLGSGIIAADHPLPIPVRLRISNLKLSGIAALGFSNKGITFCFKNDPLENINVSSTFDSMPAIKKLIERIIKSQISAFLMEDVPGLIHNFSKSSNNSSDQNSHNRSYSGDTYVPYSPSTYDSDSIYGDESDNIYSSNQTLIGEENEMMEWKRKWKGNDLNLPDSSISFENRIILYRGLKCLKTVNANRGILRLLNPSLNDYLCQSIHIDSWLITPPFSPIPLYIPKASYPSYTKDKHFSIVDYLRRTAITRTSYNQQHQRLISEGFDINNVSDDNPFKRLQQPTETIIYNIPSPITSPRLKSSMTNSSSNPNRSILFNSNKTLVSDGDISICSHHGYNYTHTYHRGQRKAKSSNKSNNLNNRKSTLSSKRSSQISSATTLFSDQENETLLNSSNSSSSVINNNNNKELENVVINKNNMDNNNNDKINLVQKKAEFDRIIPRLSSPRLSLYVTGNKGHIRGYSSQSNISDISNTPSTSSNVATSSNMNSQNNNVIYQII
ncbi:hypothetical protein BCR32DRAFT_70072 [Anaeromyces robustus]|uniref:SMP-LTD domain-containing protein n=1 Tax=Anaeromyces robustus TaxID=1754192 RepID=A0A1Y1WTR2_9FUNG|nr:hypothetical protein BCR32DRAFT_70072 [Anaeromyces robustus]|eukprot:ORX76832.1 hypothetical protein BCR32DRAFT_70072 [Anaeromyces robustus]